MLGQGIKNVPFIGVGLSEPACLGIIPAETEVYETALGIIILAGQAHMIIGAQGSGIHAPKCVKPELLGCYLPCPVCEICYIAQSIKGVVHQPASGLQGRFALFFLSVIAKHLPG